MSALDTADQISPKNATVKSMKGSLYFVLGMQEDAKIIWEESLAINPNQPAVKVRLNDLAKTLKTETVDVSNE